MVDKMREGASVLEGGESPFLTLMNSEQGLDRVSLRRSLLTPPW